eukprot:7502471-Pyramimonas_sp.AAC.1
MRNYARAYGGPSEAFTTSVVLPQGGERAVRDAGGGAHGGRRGGEAGGEGGARVAGAGDGARPRRARAPPHRGRAHRQGENVA